MHFLLKFFRKNKKKFLSVLCVASMITFVGSLAPGGFKQMFASAPTVGTVEGKPVTVTDMQTARQEWGLLRQMVYTDPQQPDVRLPFAIAELGDFDAEAQGGPGQVAFQRISSNDYAFYLLVHEAHEHGFNVPRDSEVVKSVMVNNIVPGSVPADQADMLPDAIADLLSVRYWLFHAMDIITVPRPLRDMTIATKLQEITLNLSSFPASHYLDQVPQPTTQESQKQFDDFKEFEPSKFDTDDNPLGFGYTLPQRWKVQFIGLQTPALRKAAEASKSAVDWNIAAFARFKADREHYDGLEVSIPSTQPAVAGTATTQPTTAPTMAVRKLDDLPDDFKLHVSLVLEDLYSDATNSLRVAAFRKITDAFNAGYGSYTDAKNNPTTMPAEASNYVNPHFIDNLAQSVEQQFSVQPVTGNVDQFKTAKELSEIPNVGQSYEYEPGQQQAVPFSRYAPTLALWDPARGGVLSNGNIFGPQTPQGDVYMFRLVDTDLAHVQPYDDVKDIVNADWRLSKAYGLALQAAQALLPDAQSKGLHAAAAVAGLAEPLTTGEFVPGEVLNPQAGDPSIKMVTGKPESIRAIAAAAVDMISTKAGASGRPAQLVKLPQDANVVVAELNSANYPAEWSLWGSYEESQLTYNDMRERRAELISAFCNPDSILRRMQFVLNTPASRPSGQ